MQDNKGVLKLGSILFAHCQKHMTSMVTKKCITTFKFYNQQ